MDISNPWQIEQNQNVSCKVWGQLFLLINPHSCRNYTFIGSHYHQNLPPHRSQQLIFTARLCLSCTSLVSLLSCWGASVFLCSGEALGLWIAFCLPRLSPRLPQSPAISPPPRPFSPSPLITYLATVRSHWPRPRLLRSHRAVLCLLTRQMPCEMYYFCYLVAQWGSWSLMYQPCCPVWHAVLPRDLFIAVGVKIH